MSSNEPIEVLSYSTALREQRISNLDIDTSPQTGIESIDAYLKALLPGHLTVLGAETSTGKSTISAQIAANTAMAGHKTLFFSLESGLQITTIISCYLNQKKENELNDDDLNRTIPELKIVDGDKALTVEDIKAICLQEMPKVIFIDHIHYLISDSTNMTANIGKAVRELCRLAKDLNIHIFVISHLRKPSAGQENQIPTIHSLKDSSALYQDPSVVLLLSRKRRDMATLIPGQDVFESSGLLIVAKNRMTSGGTGLAKFFFNKDLHSFEFE